MSARERRRKQRRMAVGAGLGIGAALGTGATAQAADFTVSNLNDAGPGSLRQAVLDANTNPGSDRVLFQSGLTGQITLNTGELQITDGTEVLGPGPDKLTVSGNNVSGIFHVNPANAPNMPPVTISGLRMVGGTTNAGGAIASKYTDLTVANAVLSQNNATSLGGGVATEGGSLVIRSSTVSANSAQNGGGGIFHAPETDGLGMTIQNSTVTGNTVGDLGFGGGGVAFWQPGTATASLKIESTTIANNSTTNSTYGGGGLYAYGGVSKTLTNTIIGDNTAPVNPDVVVPASSLSATFSLIENPTGATITDGPNIIGQDPKLGTLADNGGPTPTQALQAGSPAIDQGKASGVDQRGAPRPFDFAGIALAGSNQADIGAYERVECAGVLVNRVGTAANDSLTGTAGPDGILGLGGNDTISGLAGNDGLCGGPGNDKINGGAGKDTLLGEAGKDKLKGGKGNDLLKGGPGKDVLIGGKGKDKLRGGKGKDKEKQ